jgi:hypothetical protein
LLALGAATLAGSAAGAAQRPHCTGSHVRSLAESSRLRVYESDRSDIYYVCDRRTGAHFPIGEEYASSSGYTYIGPAAAAGAVAAWQDVSGPSEFEGTCYVSSDLHVRGFGRPRTPGLIALRRNGEATELVVKRNSSLAWIESRPVARDGCGDERTYLVRRRDSRGAAVLAAGSSRPQDLILHGSRLTWADGSGTHSATLR